jgi:amidase
MIAIAQGSDAGGSIRIPSAFCHLFGLKPSRGRVENSYGREDGSILYTCGPLTQSVADAAAMLDVMAGVSVGKPHWAPLPTESFQELARKRPRKLRVRFVTRSPLVETDGEIEAAVLRVVKVLAEMGHQVQEGAPLDGSIGDFLPVWQRLAADCPVHDWSKTQPLTRWLGEAGRHVRREDVERKLAKLSRDVLAWFGDVDVWVTPTVATRAPRIGAFSELEPHAMFEEAAKLGVFTAPFNVSGQPAATVPSGLSSDGLPIGVQIVGRPLGDGTVLSVCAQLEEAMPWRNRRAPRIPG